MHAFAFCLGCMRHSSRKNGSLQVAILSGLLFLSNVRGEAKTLLAGDETDNPQTAPLDTTHGFSRFVYQLDRAFSHYDKRDNSNVDTNYLTRAPERLRLQMKFNMSGSNIITRGTSSGGDYEATLEAQNKSTVSIGASYRGVTLSLALNPARLMGKNKDYEFNINAYGNHIGGDIIFQSANTFEGDIVTSEQATHVGTGQIRMNMLHLNGYYAFNGRRFSYPAAFSQSWIQYRSSGSVMIGTSLQLCGLRLREVLMPNNSFTKLDIANFGIGVGYGYNWVPRRGWLVHLSTLPQLVVFSRCRLSASGENVRTPYRFPKIIAVGRMAVVHHFSRYFVGVNTVVNTSTTGDLDQLQLSTVKWRARMFIGLKL